MVEIDPEITAKLKAMDPEKLRKKPLRLDVAARIAFPDGSMTVKGLRKERDRERLTTEIIAGKEYTTLANIEQMRELCRVQAKAPASSGGTNTGKPTDHSGAKLAGTSKMPESDAPLAAARARLKKLKDSLPGEDPSVARARAAIKRLKEGAAKRR